MTDTYELPEIVRHPDPRLQAPCQPVEVFDAALQALCDRLVRLVVQDPGSAGLAAPQIGVPLRVAALRTSRKRIVPVVNPQIVGRSPRTMVAREGCFSLPGKAALVPRSLAVTVAARTPAGKQFRLRLEGLAARVAQHEIDHLDGRLVCDIGEVFDFDPRAEAA